MQVLVGLFFLGILLVFHELGHFLVAKKMNVAASEFSVGMGPVLFAVRRGQVRYSLRLIPFGAFVRFPSKEDKEERIEAGKVYFQDAPLKRRAAIILAGPLTNILVAAFAFFLLFSFIGVGKPTTTIAEVMGGSPAALAGIKPGDQVLSVEGVPVQTWEDMVSIVQKNPGRSIRISIQREGNRLDLQVTPLDVEGRGIIGVRAQVVNVRMGPIRGIVEGLKETLLICVAWIRGLVEMLVGRAPVDVAGPVGFGQMIGEAARTGLSQLVYLLGVLSAILGLGNFLPIPALDGGRLVFFAVEAIRGKPVDPEKEGFVHLIGFVLLMMLSVVVMYKDILRLMQ